MIGSLIGGGMKLIGGIAGAISAGKAARQLRRNIAQQRQANEDWYNRRYNEDATQRGDAQRLLTQMQDTLRSANRNAAATAAVMGGTDESVAQQKAAATGAMADTMSQINAQADRRKDAIETQYQANDAQLAGQLNQLQAGKAQAIGQAAQAVGDVGAGVASAFLDSGDEDKLIS